MAAVHALLLSNTLPGLLYRFFDDFETSVSCAKRRSNFRKECSIMLQILSDFSLVNTGRVVSVFLSSNGPVSLNLFTTIL